MSVEGLCLSRHLIGNTIRQDAKRKKYFAKILDNNLYRNLCYQVFFSMAVSSNDQYEKGDRFVIPSCVVNKVIFIPVKQARQIVLQDLLLRSYSTFEYILSSILRNKRVREHLSQNSKGLQPLKGNAGGKTAGDEGKG